MRAAAVRTLSLLLLLALWESAGRLWLDPLQLPPPSGVVARAWDLSATGELWTHIAASLGRVIIGYTAGSAIGIVLGCFVGAVPVVRDFFSLPIRFFRSVNPLALVPLVILWFGVGELSKVILIAYLVTIVVLYNTALGIETIPADRIRAGRCFGLTGIALFVRVIVPAAAPGILTGLRLGVGFAVLVVIGAEMVGASEGIGYFILLGRQYVAIDDIFVGLLSLGVMGVLLNQVFLLIRNRLLRRYVRTILYRG